MTKLGSIHKYLLAAFAALSMTACQSDMLSHLGVDNPSGFFDATGAFNGESDPLKQDKMIAKKVEFSPDYKTFSVWTTIVNDIGPYSLTDSTEVRIELEEYDDGVKASRRIYPKLVRAENTESEQIAELGIKVLVLVDLSLPQELIDAQREAVEEMFTVFDKENLYVAFMSGPNVSKTLRVSDYVLEQYFKKESSKKYLFRSVCAKLREIADNTGPLADSGPLKLVIFTDGKVYSGDEPIDPDHFKMENEMLHSDILSVDSLSVFCVNWGRKSDEGDEVDATNVLTAICESSGGAYLPKFNMTLLESTMLGDYSSLITSNRFDFVNPDGKVYRGDNNQLKIVFYSQKDNHKICSVTASVREGSLYKPIIVNGDPLTEIIVEGISVGLLIMLLVYVIFQFIVPYISYRIFLKKHVVRHTGRDMVIGDKAVADTCYLCKAPFKEGEEVVVKCEHTMHKTCWDENEYHCPEYGRHCTHGSHFYNKEHILDSRNAPYYMNWILLGIVVSILAWIAFSIVTNFTTRHILEYLLPVEHLAMRDSSTHLNQLPNYGFIVGFFLTFGIACVALRKKNLMTWLSIIARATIAGLGSALLFLFVSIACIALHMEAISFLINLIPWILSSFLIAFISTYGTRIKLKKSIILIAIAVSLVSMYLWSSCYLMIGVDFRVLLLFSIMIYCVGIVLSIASAAPKSEHYFLHAQGAVKTMDIALYKWFRSNPNAVVTIGRSVDCSLQLSWDLQGNVAPVHAQITMSKGVARLVALEDGVIFSGKPLKVDKAKPLHHGTSFQIGNTLFTYQEKDI